MKTRWREFLALVSFCTCWPGWPDRPTGAEWLKTVGSYYPWVAPLMAGLTNALIVGMLFPFRQLGATIHFQALLLLTAFYSFRGLRLIDGYVDLAEGILLYLTQTPPSRDKAWATVRNPTKGVYGILSAVLLLAWQLVLYESLLRLDLLKVLPLFTLSGISGPLALSAAHLGPNRYLPDSAFSGFGEALGKAHRFLLTLTILVVLGFLLLLAVFPLSVSLGLLGVGAAMAIVTGLGLRILVLKTVSGLNGDLIGYVSLTGETVVLFAVICSLSFLQGPIGLPL